MPSRIALDNLFNVYFNYDPSIIDSIRLIDGRKYNARYKRWDIPVNIENYNTLLSILPQPIIIESNATMWYNNKMQQMESEGKQTQSLLDLSKQYIYKTTPYAHQVKSFDWAVQHRSGGLFLECGLGKTKVALDLINFYLKSKAINKVLIVIPLSVAYTWEDEIKKHTDLGSIEFLLHSSISKRKELLTNTDKQLYIINYDAIPGMEQQIIEKKFDMIICDESTYIKSYKAKRTKSILNISSHIPYRLALTGTPFGQRILDIYSQLKFISPSNFRESFFSFRNKYCEMGGYNNHEIKKYINQEELQKRISNVAIIYRKADCLDLPDKIFEKRCCIMAVDQEKAYREILEYLITIAGESIINTPNVLTQMMKLSQITGGFVIDNQGKTIRFKNNPKLKLMEETLDETDGKVVIFVKFKEDLANIKSIMKEGEYVEFSGETKDEDRQKAIETFTHKESCRYFLSTSAGGYGLNLQVAHTIIFYSHEWSIEKRQQAEDRVHRSGQQFPVTIINLMATRAGKKGTLQTIDGYVIKCCKEKKDLTNNITEAIKELTNG